MGCSLLSAVEVIYLILIEIPKVFVTECQSMHGRPNSDNRLALNQNNINSFTYKREHLNNLQKNIRFVQPQQRSRHLPPPQYSISNDISTAHLPISYYE